MSWLKQHLEEFVYPEIGKQELTPLGWFTPTELSIIKNAWRSFKQSARGKRILLPGRDTFIFEVLARREGYPTCFMPEISRKTVKYMYSKLPDTPDKFCVLDTGFVGSIPTGLFIESFKLLSHNVEHSDIHIFPRLSFGRTLALKIEGTPKYWDTAYIEQGKVHQVKTGVEEFTSAARLTLEVYTNSAPRFSDMGRFCERRSA